MSQLASAKISSKISIQLVDRIDSVIDNMQNNKLEYKKLIKEIEN